MIGFLDNRFRVLGSKVWDFACGFDPTSRVLVTE
jgi:hypothetical protein